MPSGRTIGGAVGRTWGRCCELQQLWVDAEHRKLGIASQLLRRFEARAASRGCDVFYLTTLSFQAPGFYRKHGYATLGEIRGYPQEIAKYLMIKESRDEAARRLHHRRQPRCRPPDGPRPGRAQARGLRPDRRDRELLRLAGRVANDREFRILFKSTEARYPALEAAIRELHDYELPAIHAHALERVEPAYGRWIEEGCTP